MYDNEVKTFLTALAGGPARNLHLLFIHPVQDDLALQNHGHDTVEEH